MGRLTGADHGRRPRYRAVWAAVLQTAVVALVVATCIAGAQAQQQYRWPPLLLPPSPAGGDGTAGGRAVAPLPARLNSPWRVCTSSWQPMVSCTPGGDPAEFSGYIIELFRLVAHDQGMTEGAPPTTAGDYYFDCMPYSDMIADIQSPTGGCALAAAGIAVHPDALESGLMKFSWPLYKSGLRILISGQLEAGSAWAFAAAFHWTLWLTCGITAALVGLLVAGIEKVCLGPRANAKGIGGWIWAAWAKMMFVPSHVGDPQTWASRVIFLAYGFLVLVCVFTYTAVSASNLTELQLNHHIHDRGDLTHGTHVDTWEGYVSLLAARYNITASGQPWESNADTDAMVARLRQGLSEALVLDKSTVEHLAGSTEACDLFAMGDTFETFSLALAFPSSFPDATISRFNEAVVRLQTQQGALDMLENTYVKTGGVDLCFSGDHGGTSHASGAQIELRQVSGLWYILCCSVGACLLLVAAYNIRKSPKAMERIRTFSAKARQSFQIRPVRISADSSSPPILTPGAARTSAPGRLSVVTTAQDETPSESHSPNVAAGGIPGAVRHRLSGTGALTSPSHLAPTPGRRAGASAVVLEGAGEQHAAAHGWGHSQQQTQQQQQHHARAPPALRNPEGGVGGSGGGVGTPQEDVLVLTPSSSFAGGGSQRVTDED